jgi:hypothetical protein
MADDALHVHEVPFPGWIRPIFCVLAAIPLIAGPFELWRGVWPLTWVSPVFALVMLAALGAGAVLLWIGLATPASVFRFRRGVFDAEERWPWGRKLTSLPVTEIRGIAVKRIEGSDGSRDSYRVMIATVGDREFASRHYETATEAEAEAARFRQALGV